jgi:hypothetical protein
MMRLLGGFMTFSSYGLETFTLVRDGELLLASRTSPPRFFGRKAGLAVLTLDRLGLDLFLAKRTFTNGVLSYVFCSTNFSSWPIWQKVVKHVATSA